MSGDHGVGGSAAGRHKRPLQAAFALTLAYMVAEVVGGLVTNSLALLSDAAHMGTDVIGLGMALAAIHFASRPAPAHRTYGTYRLEVLAALANSVLLFGVAGYVLFEAYRRFRAPPEVLGVPMLVVAVIGLLVNLASFRLLMAGSKESLNVKGAFLEVMSDLLGSIGVIVAAVVVATTGWTYADPLIGAGIGLFIIPRTYKLCAQAVRILIEAAPPGMDVEAVRARIAGLPGVAGVHDLHVWTLTSGMDAASGHVVVADGADHHGVLDRVTGVLTDEYGIAHTTIQCETADHDDRPTPI
ncbi:MAG: cation transporter [Actinobacteria bacterium]|nr:cation transporter [Actinomycetota bacterium]